MTQHTLDNDPAQTLAEWISEQMETFAAAQMTQADEVAALKAMLPFRYLDQVADGGLRERVKAWNKRHGLIADHTRATDTGAPRVPAEQLSFDGIVEWILAQLDAVDADLAAIDSTATDWCKANEFDRQLVDAEVARRRTAADGAEVAQ